MDKYDVSYRIRDVDDPGALAIVVDRLPYEPPDFGPLWDQFAPPHSREIRLRYTFDTVAPPGIPTWFIAREHRFTTGLYRPWRTGALLHHRGAASYAVIELDSEISLALTVRGEDPDTFLHLLDEGLQQTFDRYDGLKITRQVPCRCHPECPHLYDYEYLRRRQRQERPVECPRSDAIVDVELLLRGIPTRGNDAILQALQRLESASDRSADMMQQQFSQQAELLQRLFTEMYRAQAVQCPTVFTITPNQRDFLPGTRTYTLRLYCEEPGAWHQLPADDGCYRIRDLDPWLRAIAPHLNRIIKILTITAAGIIHPAAGIAAAGHHIGIQDDLGLKDLLEQIPAISAHSLSLYDTGAIPARRGEDEADFRIIYNFLSQVDPQQRWAGLSRVHTPEGHTLYLCDHHAARYREPSPRPAGI